MSKALFKQCLNNALEALNQVKVIAQNLKAKQLEVLSVKFLYNR